jgi:hypothetical protein
MDDSGRDASGSLKAGIFYFKTTNICSPKARIVSMMRGRLKAAGISAGLQDKRDLKRDLSKQLFFHTSFFILPPATFILGCNDERGNRLDKCPAHCVLIGKSGGGENRLSIKRLQRRAENAGSW